MKPDKRLIIFLFISMLGISFSFYAYQIFYTPNFLVGKESRLLVIPNDATFKSVQEELHKGGYVQNLLSFSFLARLTDYDKSIRPGRYIIKTDMTNLEVLKILRSGKQEPVKITFNNVRTIPDLSAKITKTLGMGKDEFSASAIKFALNNPYGFNKDNVMALFIPNTHEVYYNISPDELILRLHEEYLKFWNEERLSKAKEIGLTPIEVSILASIVQAETVKKTEAPIIAGLYINRLKKGIALQADPTLVFALGDFTLKRILNVHKEIDSPYNTYKYPGLPPGPINMPEIHSIDAVLNYTKSNYYYMCAREDFSGYHNFTNSFDEHLKNASKYQKALTREQRKAASIKKTTLKNVQF